MKVTILIRGEECRVRDGSNPEYEFLRRIEKENWEAEAVYIAEQVEPKTVIGWLEKRAAKERAYELSEIERRERETLERLKKKYEG